MQDRVPRVPDGADALPGGEGGALLRGQLLRQDDDPPAEALRPSGQRCVEHARDQLHQVLLIQNLNMFHCS